MNDTRKTDTATTRGTDANRDPITGAPGAHPVGTGVGAAAGGAAAGAAVGTVAGPVGTAVGMVADVETDLQREYEKSKGASTLGWDKAKLATRDAWHRVERAIPGDADGDGR